MYLYVNHALMFQCLLCSSNPARLDVQGKIKTKILSVLWIRFFTRTVHVDGDSVPDPAFPDLIKLRNVKHVYKFFQQKYAA